MTVQALRERIISLLDGLPLASLSFIEQLARFLHVQARHGSPEAVAVEKPASTVYPIVSAPATKLSEVNDAIAADDKLADLLPALRELQRADKLRLVQFLVFELAKEEGVASLAPGANYPVWTPYNAFEAADSLLSMLAKAQESKP